MPAATGVEEKGVYDHGKPQPTRMHAHVNFSFISRPLTPFAPLSHRSCPAGPLASVLGAAPPGGYDPDQVAAVTFWSFALAPWREVGYNRTMVGLCVCVGGAWVTRFHENQEWGPGAGAWGGVWPAVRSGDGSFAAPRSAPGGPVSKRVGCRNGRPPAPIPTAPSMPPPRLSTAYHFLN